jgi:DNA repair exonuclease SbcCD nuclease subunit
LKKPYGIISDTHHHNWTAFASVNAKGVNTRLQEILDETMRCALEVGKAGGDTIVHAGDLFHVRGSVAPSVLNPTLALYKKLNEMGFKVIINAGNHDLEGRDANDLGSAITALREVGCEVVNERTVYTDAGLCLVPYMGKVSDLKAVLDMTTGHDNSKFDLILHAGIDGVIKGLPDHGLDAEYLAKLGFHRVFSGHYHHHKELVPKKVWSVGALTHQTWGDIGTKAGFLVTYPEGQVRYSASHAPNFVEIDGTTDPDDVPLIVDGNYVRAKIYSSKPKEIDALRSFLMTSGAKGVTIVSQPATGVTRTASSVKAGASIETSVIDFIKGATFAQPIELARLCDDILKTAREAA